MSERRIALILEAKVQNFLNGWKNATRANEEFEQSTKNADKATKQASKSADERAQKIKVVAEADQRAAKAAGLLYSANGQLVNSNGKVVSSAQAAAHGVDAFSEAVYLANQEAQESAAKTAAAVEKQKQAYQTLAPAVTIAGGALTLAFGKMITTYADFDKSMSEVQAATHETTGNLNLLREAAVGAGADTAFSASEAAGGIKELAKAGVDTQAILNGGLSGALNLAATDNIEVAKAAEIAASAMTQFKLSGEAVPHIADLLAAGAGKAQGGVEDLGMALNQSGLVANGLGLTIEETTGTLTAFAAAGLTGSDSGTSFKTMLQALTPNSKKAAETMDELGLSAFDAQGNFVGMSEYAGILQNSLKGMTEEQRASTMEVIFGSDAVRAANVLYDEGAAGIQKWEDAVNDAGYAAETASLMQNNLAGDVEKLGGAFDTVFLQSGGTANDALRELVQSAESFVDMVGKIPAPILNIGAIVGGLAGGAALLGGGLITALPRIRETRDALRDLAPEGSRVDRSLRKVSGGMKDLAKGGAVAGTILGVGVALGKIAEMNYTGNIIDGTGHIAVALQDIINKGPQAAGALDAAFTGKDGGELTTSIGSMDDAIQELFADDPGSKFDNWGQSVVNSLTGIKGSKQIAEDAFGGIDTELANLLSSGNADGAAQAFSEIQKKLKDSGVSAEEAAYLFPAYSDALSRVEAESSGAAEGTGAVEEALDDVAVAADGAVKDMEAFLDILFQAGVITRDERAALRDYESTIDDITDSIKTNGTSLDETTAKGRANQAAYDALAASGEAYVRALADGGASEAELQSAMTSTYDALIVAAGQFGITGDAADKMAREVMGIPEDVKVKTWMSDEARKEAEKTKAAADALDGTTAHVWITTHENSIYSESHVSNGRGGNGGQTKATGGAIYGPGTGTSDDVPIMASNGEHMLTARDVELMGGQQAVYQFRSQLHSSPVRGYANGGAIGTPSVSVMQASSVPMQSSGSSDRALLDAKVYDSTDATRVAREVADMVFTLLRKETRRNG